MRDGETGRVAADEEFASAIAGILADLAEHERMRSAARADALKELRAGIDQVPAEFGVQ